MCVCVCVLCLRLGHVCIQILQTSANNLLSVFQTVVGLGLSSSLEALHDFLLLFSPISLLPVTGSAFANARNTSLPAAFGNASWKWFLHERRVLSKNIVCTDLVAFGLFFLFCDFGFYLHSESSQAAIQEIMSIPFVSISSQETDSPHRTIKQHVSSHESPTT